MGFYLAALWVVAIAIGHLAGLGRRTRNLLPALYIVVLAHAPLQFPPAGFYLSKLFFCPQGTTTTVSGCPYFSDSLSLRLAL